jgi:hypothetical protein
MQADVRTWHRRYNALGAGVQRDNTVACSGGDRPETAPTAWRGVEEGFTLPARNANAK